MISNDDVPFYDGILVNIFDIRRRLEIFDGGLKDEAISNDDVSFLSWCCVKYVLIFDGGLILTDVSNLISGFMLNIIRYLMTARRLHISYTKVDEMHAQNPKTGRILKIWLTICNFLEQQWARSSLSKRLWRRCAHWLRTMRWARGRGRQSR